MFIFRIIPIFLCMVMLAATPGARGEIACDSFCFSIPLSPDSNSLFWCGNRDVVRSALAGPVIMEDTSLLFFSSNGYVLYNQTGSILDSHSVFKDNRILPSGDPRRLVLAFPLDGTTICYYRKKSDSSDSLEIFEKKIRKKGISRINGGIYSGLKEIERGQIFNIANNIVTDEMAPKLFLVPNLAGYASLNSGTKWWCLDKFHSFMSPLIVMHNEVFQSLFMGLLSDQKTDIQKLLITPLGTYTIDGRRYYCGVHSFQGSTDSASLQTIFFCDEPGNAIFTSQLLKQVIGDDVLAFDKKRNKNFTVKRPSQFVFLPAIDKNGDIFYCRIDYSSRLMEVKKRRFFRFCRRMVEPAPELQGIVDAQRVFTCRPISLPCRNRDEAGSTETGFLLRGQDGIRRAAERSDVTCKGFYVKLSREVNQDFRKRFSQIPAGLPARVKQIKDSLAGLPNFSCPCRVTLYHEREKVRDFYFRPFDEAVGARVLNVVETGDVFIRVDFMNWAEVLVFSRDGMVNTRFTFNRQDFRKRKDIVGVRDNGTVVEEDYERIEEDYTFYNWEVSLAQPELQNGKSGR